VYPFSFAPEAGAPQSFMRKTPLVSAALLVLLAGSGIGLIGAAGCSSTSSSRTNPTPKSDAGPDGAAGSVGSGGAAGSGGSGGSAGSSGSAGSGGTGGCQAGESQCAGDVPQTCDENGRWVNGTPCAPPTPVCSGGTCAAFRLRGGIESLGVRPPPATIRLRDDKIENTARLCNGTMCVSGGIPR
jgi:hypothetical protein